MASIDPYTSWLEYVGVGVLARALVVYTPLTRITTRFEYTQLEYVGVNARLPGASDSSLTSSL